jgi:hypothetical protein
MIAYRSLFVILILTFVVEIACHFLHRVELVPDLPRLPEVGAGCQTDMLTGVMDCLYVFDNGTFIHKRGL